MDLVVLQNGFYSIIKKKSNIDTVVTIASDLTMEIKGDTKDK